MLCCIRQIVANAIAAHLLTIFYERRFVWQDLQRLPDLMLEFNHDWDTRIKELLIFLTLHFGPWLSVHQVHLATVLLAIPQLYRVPVFRNYRIVLGPLTPILAVLNVMQKQNLATVSSLIFSLAGFVVFRPDNSQVLDLLLLWRSGLYKDIRSEKMLKSANQRRKMHGVLALSNTAVAATAVVLFASSSIETCQAARWMSWGGSR